MARSKKRPHHRPKPTAKASDISPKEAENPLEDTKKFFAFATLRGPHDLRPHLGLDESSFRSVAGFSHQDARAYYLYAVLDEIQKLSVAIRHWSELLGNNLDSRKEFEPADHLHRFILESVLDEQDFRQRRLLEILIDLICLRTTNEQYYYRHLMLLDELRYNLSAILDFRDFYDISNLRLQEQAQKTIARIHELEDSTVDVTKCWYRKNRKRLETKPSPSRLLSSVRSRLQVALTEATAYEKLVLGLSYYAYSRASSGVHFQTKRQRFILRLEEVQKGISMSGGLALTCLVSVQKLLSLTPEGLSSQIREVLESDEVTKMFETLIGARAVAGDFVLAYDRHLSEVLEVKKNKFGYESYLVRFLEDVPPFGIVEDWLPPQEIRRMYELDHLVKTTREDLVSDGVAPDRISDESLKDAIRQAMIDTWKLALRDIVLKRASNA